MKAAYTVDGAAEQYSVSPDTIRKAIHAGELAAKKLGTKYSIPAESLAKWHTSLPDAA